MLPSLVSRLRRSPSAQVVRILHLLLRAHEEVLGLLLTEADHLLAALRESYPKLDGIRAKSDVLLVCEGLVRAVQGGQSGEALKRLMGEVGPDSEKRVLVDAGLREDYDAVFEGGRGIALGDGEMGELRRMKEEEAAGDPVRSLTWDPMVEIVWLTKSSDSTR